MRYRDGYEEYDDEDEYEYEAPAKRRKGGRLNRLLFFIAAVAVAAGTYIGCLGYEMYSRAVTAVPLEKKAEELRSAENYTRIGDIPDFYLEAVVAVEDRRFYSHHGFDIRSFGRAVIRNVKERRLAEGGSTITQQLAKNLYYTQEKSFVRKAAELFTAFDIERTFTKEEILEFYVNNIYYGEDCYSIGDASEHYFGIPPSEMDRYDSSLLAGLPNAPSVYSADPVLAKKRQRQVLEAMADAGYIEEKEIEQIVNNNKR